MVMEAEEGKPTASLDPAGSNKEGGDTAEERH